MKTRVARALGGMLVAVAILTTAACGGSDVVDLSGTSWVTDDGDTSSRVTFREDGTAVLEDMYQGDTFEVVDDKATWTFEEGAGMLVSDVAGVQLPFTVDGDELTISLNGEAAVFDKE